MATFPRRSRRRTVPGAAKASRRRAVPASSVPASSITSHLNKARKFADLSTSCRTWPQARRTKAARTVGKLVVLTPSSAGYRALAKKGGGAACIGFADKALSCLSKARAAFRHSSPKMKPAKRKRFAQRIKAAEAEVYRKIGFDRTAAQEAQVKVAQVSASKAVAQAKVAAGQPLTEPERQEIKTSIKLQLAPLRVEGKPVPTDAQVDAMTDEHAMTYEATLDEQAESEVLYEASPLGFLTERPLVTAGVGLGMAAGTYFAWKRFR